MSRRRFDQNNNRVDYGELLIEDPNYELDQAVLTVPEITDFSELNNEKGKKRMEFDKVKAMDMSFDISKIFQERLASSMGLDKYLYIMEQVSTTNVAADPDFQRIFNGFYIVRRNEIWRKVYYAINEQI